MNDEILLQKILTHKQCCVYCNKEDTLILRGNDAIEQFSGCFRNTRLNWWIHFICTNCEATDSMSFSLDQVIGVLYGLKKYGLRR